MASEMSISAFTRKPTGSTALIDDSPENSGGFTAKVTVDIKRITNKDIIMCLNFILKLPASITYIYSFYCIISLV